MENKKPDNDNQKKAEVAILISVKIDIRVKSFTTLLEREKERDRETERKRKRDLKQLGAGNSTMYRAGWQTRDPGESWYSFESEGRLEAEFLLSWGICLFSYGFQLNG